MAPKKMGRRPDHTPATAFSKTDFVKVVELELEIRTKETDIIEA